MTGAMTVPSIMAIASGVTLLRRPVANTEGFGPGIGVVRLGLILAGSLMDASRAEYHASDA